MCVVHGMISPRAILQLNCSHVPFTINEILESGVDKYFGICYIPSHRLIVVSDHTPSVVRAMSCDTGEKVWELPGEVHSVSCEPCGMVYCPKHHALLVADGGNHQILVVAPSNGSVRQVMQLSSYLGVTIELCLHQEKVILLHHDGKRVKVSFLMVQ